MSLKALGYATAAERERRHAARWQVESLVYLKISPDNGGILHDLNESGMRVSVANPLGPGDDCRFSVFLNDHTPVRGVARVAWLSESGKAAGLSFVDLSEDSQRQIRQWLEMDAQKAAGDTPGKGEGNNRVVEMVKPAPNESEAAQTVPEATEAAPPKLKMPLFFLPEKQIEDEPEAETPATEMRAPTERDSQEGLEEVRLALKQSPEEQESKKGTMQEVLFAIRLVCVATLALAGGFLFIYKGGDALQYVKRYAPFDITRSLAKPVEHTMRTPHARRTSRHFRPSQREKTTRESNAATPRIWTEPQGGHPFQLEVTDSFNRHWLISASGQKMIPVDHAQATEATDAAMDAPEEPGGTSAPSSSATTVLEEGKNTGAAVKPNTVVPPKVQFAAKAPFSVVLDALIDKNGNVKDVHVVSSPSAALAWAVVEAVKQWHYPPFYRQGHPAEVVTRITVAFRGSTPKP